MHATSTSTCCVDARCYEYKHAGQKAWSQACTEATPSFLLLVIMASNLLAMASTQNMNLLEFLDSFEVRFPRIGSQTRHKNLCLCAVWSHLSLHAPSSELPSPPPCRGPSSVRCATAAVTAPAWAMPAATGWATPAASRRTPRHPRRRRRPRRWWPRLRGRSPHGWRRLEKRSPERSRCGGEIAITQPPGL